MNPGWLPGPVKRSGGSAYDDAQLPFGRYDLGPVHTKTIVNANFYLCPHEDDYLLRSVFTRPHENARKRIKRCHTPNAHALSI